MKKIIENANVNCFVRRIIDDQIYSNKIHELNNISNKINEIQKAKQIFDQKEFDSSHEQNWNIQKINEIQKVNTFNNEFSKEIETFNFTDNTKDLIFLLLKYSGQIEYQTMKSDLLFIIIENILKNIYTFINQRARKRLFKKKNYKLPYYKTLFEKKIDNLLDKIFESKILDILSGKFAPKTNNIVINELKRLIEIENKSQKVKLIRITLNTNFKDIFNMYMKSDNYIKDNSEDIINVNMNDSKYKIPKYRINFITLNQDYFKYSITQKKEIMKNILSTLNNKLVNINFPHNRQESDENVQSIESSKESSNIENSNTLNQPQKYNNEINLK